MRGQSIKQIPQLLKVTRLSKVCLVMQARNLLVFTQAQGFGHNLGESSLFTIRVREDCCKEVQEKNVRKSIWASHQVLLYCQQLRGTPTLSRTGLNLIRAPGV